MAVSQQRWSGDRVNSWKRRSEAPLLLEGHDFPSPWNVLYMFMDVHCHPRGRHTRGLGGKEDKLDTHQLAPPTLMTGCISRQDSMRIAIVEYRLATRP